MKDKRITDLIIKLTDFVAHDIFVSHIGPLSGWKINELYFAK